MFRHTREAINCETSSTSSRRNVPEDPFKVESDVEKGAAEDKDRLTVWPRKIQQFNDFQDR